MKNYVLDIDHDNEEYFRTCESVDISSETGIKYRFFFPNGLVGSVIKFEGSYGWKEDKWEVMMLDQTLELICMDEFENGPIGYLDDKEVNDLLRKIRSKNYETNDISS